MMTKQELDDYKRRMDAIMSDPETVKRSEEFHRKMQRKNAADMDLRFTNTCSDNIYLNNVSNYL